jgi:trk system potassium uptake protein TrkA
MNVVIAGAGEVGRHTAEVLAHVGHNIVMIDRSAETLAAVEDVLDVSTMLGSACDARVLTLAGVPNADLLVAATDTDEINLLCAAIGKGLGAKKTIARVHHSAYQETEPINYALHLNIDALIPPEYLTSLEIARMLRNPGAMAVELFARGQIEMQQIFVNEGAEAIGVSLKDLRAKLPRGALLGAIDRGGDAFVPGAESVIQAQDIVWLLGESASFAQARALFQKGRIPRRHIVIMGGTAMTVWLARQLRGRHFSVRVFVTDRARAEELAEKLSHVTVVHADPSDPVTFAEEHVEEADAFVALSENDEHNILTAVQAKSAGVKQTVVVIQQPTYLHLLESIGIDHAYSPRVIASREILRMADESPLQKLATLAQDVADIYQIQPTRGSRAVDTQLVNLRFPKGCFVAAIEKGGDVSVPGAKHVIHEGDRVVVIAKHGIERDLRQFFLGK